jgi:anaerobic C4-dicarboxylate transporter
MGNGVNGGTGLLVQYLVETEQQQGKDCVTVLHLIMVVVTALVTIRNMIPVWMKNVQVGIRI